VVFLCKYGFEDNVITEVGNIRLIIKENGIHKTPLRVIIYILITEKNEGVLQKMRKKIKKGWFFL